MIFLSLCLQMISGISCSITFPGMKSGWLAWSSKRSPLALLEGRRDICSLPMTRNFSQSSWLLRDNRLTSQWQQPYGLTNPSALVGVSHWDLWTYTGPVFKIFSNLVLFYQGLTFSGSTLFSWLPWPGISEGRSFWQSLGQRRHSGLQLCPCLVSSGPQFLQSSTCHLCISRSPSIYVSLWRPLLNSS